MPDKIKEILNKNGKMIIDGSMGTALKQMGADLTSDLWTTRALIDTPELVEKVHYDYFKAGADCSITCTYQASISGLMKNGFSHDDSAKIIASGVDVFNKARDRWWNDEGKQSGRVYPLCLAGIGPYGACLNDGSEYRGGYFTTEEYLREFHEEKAGILWNSGADILLFETQPSLDEALVEADIAENLKADYWISFSCRDGHRISEGTLISECAKILSKNHPGLKMIGVNCTYTEYVYSLIKDLKESTDIPVAVFPNSTDIFDHGSKKWVKRPGQKSFEEFVLSYFEAGADAVGGCCTTTCEHIEQVVKARDTFCSKQADY